MYLMWARGERELQLADYQFPFPNVSSHEGGVKMLQLLRADKLLIPETLVFPIFSSILPIHIYTSIPILFYILYSYLQRFENHRYSFTESLDSSP